MIKKIDKAISSSCTIKEGLKTLGQQIAQLDKDDLHVGKPKELDKLVEIEISFDKSMPMKVCGNGFHTAIWLLLWFSFARPYPT